MILLLDNKEMFDLSMAYNVFVADKSVVARIVGVEEFVFLHEFETENDAKEFLLTLYEAKKDGFEFLDLSLV